MDKVMKADPRFFGWLNKQEEDIQEDYQKAKESEKQQLRSEWGFPDIEEIFVNKAIHKVKSGTADEAAVVDELYSQDIDWEKLKAGLKAGLFKK